MSRRSIKVFLAIMLFVSGVSLGQSSRSEDYDVSAAYEVYSAVLSSYRHSDGSKPREFVIRMETITSFGTFLNNVPDRTTCLRPGPESPPMIGDVLNDLIKVNQTKWRLKKKFDVDIDYRFIDSKEVVALATNDDWKRFFEKYPNSAGVMDLSAVGFNHDKTIAIFSVGRRCGILCGEGEYHFLQKTNGKWVPFAWKGNRCSWIS